MPIFMGLGRIVQDCAGRAGWGFEMFFGQTNPIAKPISRKIFGVNGLQVIFGVADGAGAVDAASAAGL
jgi:hypothetical protein